MSLYFAFELQGLARRCLHPDPVEGTRPGRRVGGAVAEVRDEVARQRPPRRHPH
ncbi:hypothetical protein [Streptomyces sp. NPDC048577]|uniref:hypothetical protein n=1 Tax=Streptomyces sp. NPDC048577 TaxID=3157209 RepID=UPI0034224013